EGIVEEIVGRHPDLRMSRGKKVFEIQPRTGWDKGRAVGWLLENTRLGENDQVALYIGDDLTDEDAFAALIGRGVSIAVRGRENRMTIADYTLQDPADVQRFLAWLKAFTEDTA
ncbi:MAG: trehalose-phosphatase, partial [Alphaproteobacteria bacterium]|nr:trehalose-phosphatase [Alphaproteobacteria bacterium]